MPFERDLLNLFCESWFPCCLEQSWFWGWWGSSNPGADLWTGGQAELQATHQSQSYSPCTVPCPPWWCWSICTLFVFNVPLPLLPHWFTSCCFGHCIAFLCGWSTLFPDHVGTMRANDKERVLGNDWNKSSSEYQLQLLCSNQQMMFLAIVSILACQMHSRMTFTLNEKEYQGLSQPIVIWNLLCCYRFHPTTFFAPGQVDCFGMYNNHTCTTLTSS